MMDTTAFERAQKLRDAGYLVVIWTPEEIAKVDNLKYLEERITELGNETISLMEAI